LLCFLRPGWGVFIVAYAHVLLNHLRTEHSLCITDEGVLYAYVSEEGIFQKLNHQTLSALVKEHIPEEIRNVRETENLVKELSTDYPNIKDSDFNPEHLVAFEDGTVLDVYTGATCGYSPDWLLTRRLPGKYLPEATMSQAPVFDKFMQDLLSSDNTAITTLLEFMGGVLSNVYGWRFKKVVILVGPGGTGKSKWRELLMHLVGEDNCMSIDLANLVARFGAITLAGKRLGGSGDMASVDLEEISSIKNLTGGDAMFGEQKCVQAKSFRFDGFLLFVTNVLPYWRGDRGPWVYERFLIVRTDQPIPVELRDPKLLEKMLEEKDVIINVALQHLMAATKRKFSFTESEFSEMEREQHKIANNSLLSFVAMCCDRNAKSRTKRSDFNEVYRAWCRENNVRPERSKEIEGQLAEHFQIRCHKSCGYYFYDLAILDEVRNELNAANNQRQYH